MKTIGVVQARFGSKRLPGKILAPLAGLPLLAVIVERLGSAPLDEVWLATTESPADDVTALWGGALGMRVYRGSDEDVLSRFVAIIRQTAPDWVVRLTADDPFVDSEVVALLVHQAQALGAEWSMLSQLPSRRRLPLGYAPQIARASAILGIDARLPSGRLHHRAHVLSRLHELNEVREFEIPRDWPERPAWRWTVDTPADHLMAVQAFDLLGPGWRQASYLDLVRELDAAPQITGLNVHVQQKDVAEG